MRSGFLIPRVAVDEMLPLCTHILTSEGVRPITEADKENITKLCLSMSEGALRVLGFAMRTLTELPTDDDENVEFDMTFVGVTGMIDPAPKGSSRFRAYLPSGGHPNDYGSPATIR